MSYKSPLCAYAWMFMRALSIRRAYGNNKFHRQPKVVDVPHILSLRSFWHVALAASFVRQYKFE